MGITYPSPIWARAFHGVEGQAVNCPPPGRRSLTQPGGRSFPFLKPFRPFWKPVLLSSNCTVCTQCTVCTLCTFCTLFTACSFLWRGFEISHSRNLLTRREKIWSDSQPTPYRPTYGGWCSALPKSIKKCRFVD